MRTRDVLAHKGNPAVISVSPLTTVYEAIELMAHHHIGALTVMQDDNLIGILSERDYARKVILQNRSSKATHVSEIMTADVITVAPDDGVDECVDKMREHHIRHLVVVEAGAVPGMLSLRDLYTEIIQEQSETIDQLQHYVRGEPT